jgi:bifunctional non-homologous end joining protein LigD
MARSARSAVRIGTHALTLSNLDKVLWPGQGYTKGDLIAYYRAVAKWLVPYLKNRPLSLERYPNGIRKPGFFEKNAPAGLPPWVKSVTLKGGGKRAQVRYILCNDEATLAYVANLAAIALHAWMSRTGSLDQPDFILFDLDRGDGCTLGTLATVALAVASALRRKGLRCVPKTTGGSGLHIFVWTRGRFNYEQGRALTHEIAQAVQTQLPKAVTLERMIAKRGRGKVYMDWAQVARGKTVVMPFTVRAKDNAPVSMPLRWSDVQRLRRSPELDTAKYFARWNIRTVPALLRRSGDPWKARGA